MTEDGIHGLFIFVTSETRSIEVQNNEEIESEIFRFRQCDKHFPWEELLRMVQVTDSHRSQRTR
jgi:hypothetical protein